MENNNKNINAFSYTYSAKEQAEIKAIRQKYGFSSEKEEKMARLRKLDASVTQGAQAVALIFGIIGALALGFGMSLFMTNLGDFIFSSVAGTIAVGIICGILGGILIGLAYPIYIKLVKRKREIVAPEIIRISDELLQ